MPLRPRPSAAGTPPPPTSLVAGMHPCPPQPQPAYPMTGALGQHAHGLEIHPCLLPTTDNQRPWQCLLELRLRCAISLSSSTHVGGQFASELATV
jgi:hypothetical protein